MSLLHPDETAPSSNKFFTKFPEGKTKIHIFSEYMLQYHEVWTESKECLAAKTEKELFLKIKKAISDGKIFKEGDEKPQYRVAIVCAIWDTYGIPKIEILKLSQKSLVNSLIDIDNSPEWGGLQKHPIEIKREGSGQYGTKYSANSLPHSPFPQELLEEAGSVSLAQLLIDGGNPFGEDTPATPQDVPPPPQNPQQGTIPPLPPLQGTPSDPYSQ